jgi:transcriptional regulator with XRE-family HTH domain
MPDLSHLGVYVKHTEIRKKRRLYDLSLAVVAKTVGRTRAWLSKVELGQISTDHESLARIDEAVDRLNLLRQSALGSQQLGDLKLPRARNRKG